MTATSPSFPRGLPPLRSEAEVRAARAENALAAAIFPTAFRAGQTSRGSAMADERAKMERVTAARLALHDALVEAANGSEFSAELLQAADMLDDLVGDCEIGRDVWTAKLEAME